MIKRAFFYTTRKKGKTLILLLTLFVISTFVLTGLSSSWRRQTNPH